MQPSVSGEGRASLRDLSKSDVELKRRRRINRRVSVAQCDTTCKLLTPSFILAGRSCRAIEIRRQLKCELFEIMMSIVPLICPGGVGKVLSFVAAK
jgi:hypothetical protein